jgi:DMSO/TMAO reductase YedYZ molybdopterin-dependent catalytic subunit
MADALHPLTLLTYGMSGNELPVRNGGPLRMRLPRQLGYRSVKFINRLTVTDSLKGLGKGLGSASPEGAGVFRFSQAGSGAGRSACATRCAREPRQPYPDGARNAAVVTG